MRKKFRYNILFLIVLTALVFVGCNREITGNSAEGTASEAISGTASETASATVSETEEKIPEPQAALSAEKKGYEPYQIKLYNSLGTGIPRPDDYGMYRIRYDVYGKPEEFLSLLKDKDVSEKIDSGIKEWLGFLEENYHYSYEQLTDDEYFYTSCWAYNGILFYRKCLEGYSSFEKYCTAFDLRTGERLELSDLFFEEEEFIGELNKRLWEEIQKLTHMVPYDYEPVDYVPMKREFAGLTENGFCFDLYKFYFPKSNPYFLESREINLNLFDFDTVLNVPCDMREFFEEGADEFLEFRSTDYNFSTSFFMQTGNIGIYFLDESPKLTEKQREFFNNKALSLTSSEFLDKMRERGWRIYSDDEPVVYRISKGSDGTEYYYKDIFTIDIYVIKNNFVEICCGQDNLWEAPVPRYSLYYDLETLEPLDTEQLLERVFGDDEYVWADIAVYALENTLEDWSGFIRNEAPDLSRIKPEDMYTYGSGIYYYGQVDGSNMYGTISKKHIPDN